MDYTIFTFPVSLTEIESIENIVERAGCLLTSFNFLQEEQYRTKTFLFNDDLEFRVLLDRNFVSELVHIFSLVTTQKNFELSEEQRIIAAHQAFFQLSNILCEPNISYYEYADQQNYHNVSKELNVFRKADNLPTEIWVSLALGKYPLISPKHLAPIDGTEFLKEEAKKKLKTFEANYIVIKKAISLKKKGLANHEIMLDLIEWLHKEYLFTGPSVFFLNFYLCPNKPGLKNMVKNHSIDGLRNATWDLTFLQEYMSKLKNEIANKNNERWLACSNDNAIKKIIPLLFASYDEEIVDFHKRIKNVFIESWGKNTGIGKKIYKARFHKKAYSQERKVNQDNFSEHIEKIKKELNEELMLKLQ
jgi:hypothetical protein